MLNLKSLQPLYEGFKSTSSSAYEEVKAKSKEIYKGMNTSSSSVYQTAKDAGAQLYGVALRMPSTVGFYLNAVNEKYTEQTKPQHPIDMIRQSKCYHNNTSLKDLKGYEISIQLVNESHYHFYEVHQWGAHINKSNHSIIATIEIFPETGQTWVRMESQIGERYIKEFQPTELMMLIKLFENAQGPIRGDLLVDFQSNMKNHKFYKTKRY